MAAKNIILKSKIEGVIYELMVKTVASQVYLEDGTTLAAKLSTILADIASKASTEEMTAALAQKAEKVHTHEQADVNGLVDLLKTLATTESLNTAIGNLRSEIMGDQVNTNFDTFTEMAKYIEEHQEAADALNAAIGTKADKSVVEALQATVDGLGALATLDKVGEDNLTDELKEKVNAAAEGNHSHLNKTVLDGITAEKVAAWDASEQNAKDYADGLAANYDAKGAAAAAEQAAKTYADGLAGNYDAAGSAATAEQNAKTYADGKASAAESAAKSHAETKASEAQSAAQTYADGLNTAMDTRVKAVEAAKHEHANKTVLDGITAEKVTAWDGKSRVLVNASQPADMTEQDLWIQIVE